MKTLGRFFGMVVLAWLTYACAIFEDQTPELLYFHLSGTVGQEVTVIYSKQFVAGVDETGVTRIQVFAADTVVHVLPIDTVIDIRFERQMFLQVESPNDTIDVNVGIDIDDRNVFDKSGGILPTIPFRYLYRFNHAFTDNIDVVL